VDVTAGLHGVRGVGRYVEFEKDGLGIGAQDAHAVGVLSRRVGGEQSWGWPCGGDEESEGETDDGG
jgi:hypothetical protein